MYSLFLRQPSLAMSKKDQVGPDITFLKTRAIKVYVPFTVRFSVIFQNISTIKNFLNALFYLLCVFKHISMF